MAALALAKLSDMTTLLPLPGQKTNRLIVAANDSVPASTWTSTLGRFQPGPAPSQAGGFVASTRRPANPGDQRGESLKVVTDGDQHLEIVAVDLRAACLADERKQAAHHFALRQRVSCEPSPSMLSTRMRRSRGFPSPAGWSRQGSRSYVKGQRVRALRPNSANMLRPMLPMYPYLASQIQRSVWPRWISNPTGSKPTCEPSSSASPQ